MPKKTASIMAKAYSREEKREPWERGWSKEEMCTRKRGLKKQLMLFETANYIYYKWKKSHLLTKLSQGSYIGFAHT